MRRSIISLALATALALLPATTLAQDHVIDESSETQFLTVLSAPSGSIDGDLLTLEGVPSVLYFSDRPARIAGHMAIKDFVEEWGQGRDSFAADPPNATLSVLGSKGIADSVIELVSVEHDGDAVGFRFVTLEGEPPSGEIGPMSLFIDLLGNFTPCTRCASG